MKLPMRPENSYVQAGIMFDMPGVSLRFNSPLFKDGPLLNSCFLSERKSLMRFSEESTTTSLACATEL